MWRTRFKQNLCLSIVPLRRVWLKPVLQKTYEHVSFGADEPYV